MDIEISKNVLYDIACTALESIEGIELANAPIKVGEVLNNRSARRPKAMKVNRDGEGVTIDVGVNVEYGQNLVALSQNAQRTITENVELMTGLRVRAVNVTVQGLNLPKGA